MAVSASLVLMASLYVKKSTRKVEAKAAVVNPICECAPICRTRLDKAGARSECPACGSLNSNSPSLAIIQAECSTTPTSPHPVER
ncbi:hypothetical protein BDV97DRAFT_158768 [Delphinella strobiligena]|nr:hypothetical protein BDV97DRAFT_158768 [Delphinella strobiligena]